MTTVARRLTLLVLLAVATAIGLPAVALAHADVAASEPAEGAVVAPGSLTLITLTFTEAVADGSSIELVGPGVALSTNMPSSDGLSMSLPAPARMPAGVWEIRWTTVAGDGDIERGVIHFRVAEVTEPSPEQPTAGATDGATDEASPAPPGDGTGSSGGDGVFVPVAVLGVLIVAGGAWFLRRRSGSPA